MIMEAENAEKLREMEPCQLVFTFSYSSSSSSFELKECYLEMTLFEISDFCF